jgi:hypothetical protein
MNTKICTNHNIEAQEIWKQDNMTSPKVHNSFFFLQYWRLNSRPCKLLGKHTITLATSFCNGYFWDRVSLYVWAGLDHNPGWKACATTPSHWLRQSFVNFLLRLARNYRPLISTSQVARITAWATELLITKSNDISMVEMSDIDKELKSLIFRIINELTSKRSSKQMYEVKKSIQALCMRNLPRR